MRIGAIFEKLSLCRVYILAAILSALVALLVYIHTGAGEETLRNPPPIPFRSKTEAEKKDERKRFELSLKPWGPDPFVSPLVEESLKRQHEEELKRLKEEEERRRREEELREKKEKEKEERRRREEEERRRREEDKRKKAEEESRRRVAEIAARMVAKGVLHLIGGDMVIIGDDGYRVGDKIEAGGEKFRLIRIEEDFVVIEDRYGRRHKVRILE